MRKWTFIFFVLTISKAFGQSKIDTTLLLKKNWIQCDDKITYINHCYDCKSANITLTKDKKWGNISDKKTEIVIGDWKIENGNLVLYDPLWHGLGHICHINTLTDTSLVFWYFDLKEIPRYVKLKPK